MAAIEKFFSKLNFGGPNGPFPQGDHPLKLVGVPEGRGRLDPKPEVSNKNVSMG